MGVEWKRPFQFPSGSRGVKLQCPLQGSDQYLLCANVTIGAIHDLPVVLKSNKLQYNEVNCQNDAKCR
jgi:hypothetical protein